MIGAALAAKAWAMGANNLWAWLDVNHQGLLIGLAVGAAIVAVMLILREVGRRTVAHDPEGWGWRTVIGHVLARTSLAFMVLAAADAVTNYADLPHKIARIIDILFVIAFALQGAVWLRELILGIIARRVAGEQGAGTLANAMAIIRLLVSVTLFAMLARYSASSTAVLPPPITHTSWSR